MKKLTETLFVSTKLTGKMENMVAISSASTQNPNCARLSKCKGSICQHCFSQRALSYRQNVKKGYERNGRILSEGIIPKKQLPFINGFVCRLESHGDIINITHLQNFINICNHNKQTQFALWTKQYKLILDYFKTHKQPTNLNLIISSLMVNKPINPKPFEDIGLKVKIFTVFDKTQAENIEINCGHKRCLDCLNCYRKNGKIKYINEIIK